MKLLQKLFLSTTLTLLIFSTSASTFGGTVDNTKLVEVADILAKPQSYLQQQVTVKGTVEAVCQKKGCWMQFAADANQPTFRIKVKDGDMVFPVSAKGKTAYASGRLDPIEIAPRVHNSGHWTQQGADTCQFENHLRAVCGLPLGSTALVRPTLMVNILGEDHVSPAVLSLPSCHLHWYGKGKRPGRKMGHINLSATSTSELAQRFDLLRQHLPEQEFPELDLVAARLKQLH